MKINLLLSGLLIASSAALCSCDDDNNIGSSLIDIDASITVDDNFQVTGKSVAIDGVQSRTIMQLVGEIEAEGYGKLSADFLTQFMPVAEIDASLSSSDQIDGFRLLLMHKPGALVGDSVVPMGVEVYRLTKTLEAPIFSNLDPTGYFDQNQPLGGRVYTSSNSELSDSLAKLNYREIFVDLPVELGKELFEIYKTNPAAYNDPYLFNDLFKGLYVRNSFGSGRVAKIGATAMQILYHQDTVNAAGRDTTINHVGTFYSVSPEIITNNSIRYEMAPSLQSRIANGENLIIAPAGQEVEIEFPIEQVMASYRNNKSKLSVINDLTFTVVGRPIQNSYDIVPPTDLLLILKSKKKEFFEESKIPDSETSFYATYDSATGNYKFTSMRPYLLNMLSKSAITPDDYTFIITPVEISTESTGNAAYGNVVQYVTAVAPYVAQPAMVSLDLKNAKVVLTYGSQQK